MNTAMGHLRHTKSQRLDDPYAVTGRKAYLIGLQDGRFPNLGHHVPDEMGGLWSHPIKVLDGFWLGIGEDVSRAAWLPPAEVFETSPVGSKHSFRLADGLKVELEAWIPHDEPALVLTYRFQHAPARGGRGASRLPVVMLFRTDLRGVWLSERLGWKDGMDQAAFHPEEGIAHAWDDEMPFHALVGAAPGTPVRTWAIERDLWGPERTAGNGISIALCLDLPVGAEGGAAVTFLATSSPHSLEEARAAWGRVASNLQALRAEKESKLEEILSYSRLRVDDPDLPAVLDDIKMGYEHLYREVDGYGAGLGAGLPEYPWWFGCDNSYALQGALCLGRFEMALDTLRLLAGTSRQANGNGRIIHEVTTNGVVFNPGNTQETPHFVMAVWEAFLWTGDAAFLRELYPLCRQGVFEWLLGAQDSDGDLFPEGYGIMEVAGLNWELIDTAVYTQRALEALAQMAAIVDDPPAAARAAELAARLKERIEERFWLEEEGLYADLIAPPRAVLERLGHIRGQHGYQSAAMDAALDAMERTCRGRDPDTELPWLFKTWVVFCPLEAGVARADRAMRALERMRTREFTGRFGLYLSGINQDRVMTISTGVAAVAMARYRRADAALGYIRQIASTRHLRFPGAPSEMSPDSGCFVQAWTGYGVAVPIVRHFLGVTPSAPTRRLRLAPCLPEGWENARLERLRVGDRAVDIAYRIDPRQARIAVEVSGLTPDWTVELALDPARHGFPSGEYALSVNGDVLAAYSFAGAPGGLVEASWRSARVDVAVLERKE